MNKYTVPSRILSIAFFAVLLLVGTSSLRAVTLLGQPFTPVGANYSIFALQGIDASHTFGDPSFSPQVNLDFEFDGSTGVSYQKTPGSGLTDFGIGLYQPVKNGATFSTGLNFQYNQAVLASSVTITVRDFDIGASDTFFNNQKVEPRILLLGANNTVYASASPTDIFPNLIANTTVSGGKKAADDVWDIRFADLLNTLHLADAPITGFILYADTLDGERANSDPYLFIGTGNGIPVIPETGNYVFGVAAILIAGLFQLKQLRQKRKATISA
jgi:hypothetical protein